jgi:hypothetical protein
MKRIEMILVMPVIFLILLSCTATTSKVNGANPQFVIEREIPGAGKLTAEELRAASQKSCEVLRDLGPEIKWLHSYVTDDKIYCVYTAPSRDLIIEHARLVGVPANTISKVVSVVGPATAK